MNNEDRDFLHTLSKKLEKTIDSYFEKTGEDRSFYRFDIKCHLLWTDFKVKRIISLIDDRDACSFCGQPTHYSVDDVYMCAECYAKQEKV